MQSFREKFEKDLKEKLRQRCDTKQTEHQTLLRMFKYFDQQNKGTVDVEQFVRVLEKTGMYYPLPTLQALFNEYDVDQSGGLDYRELALTISGEHKIKSWTPAPQSSIPTEKSQEIIQSFRQKLLLKGMDGLAALQSAFRKVDTNNTATLDFQEFQKAVLDTEIGAELSIVEVRNLFEVFDQNQNGTIDFPEFVQVIRGQLPGVRLVWVEKAWNSLDRQGLNQVSIDDMMRIYNAAQHPACLDGRHTEEETREEFCATFWSHHKDHARDWCTFGEFCEYYTDVSALIESDDYFIRVISGTWSLDNRKVTDLQMRPKPDAAYNARPKSKGQQVYFSGQENNQNCMLPSTRYYQGRSPPIRKSIAYSPPRRDGFQYKETPGQSSADFNLHNNNTAYVQHVKQTQPPQNFERPQTSKAGYHSQKELLLKKIRTSMSKRGIRALISLKRQFKVIDAENRGYLELNEFLQAFDDLKISNIESGDLNMIFGIYDFDRKCQINYQAFLTDLYEELPQIRQQAVQEAFVHMDLDRSESLDLTELKNCFEPTRHPDVIKGIKTVDEVRFEFFNLFTTLHGANHQFNSEAGVTLSDFMEYHTIVNSEIERDADFKNYVTAIWNLDVREQPQRQAGGIQNVEIARQADRNAREMYRNDFHRKTFGNEQILQHNLPEDFVDQRESEPKIITNPALRNRVVPQVQSVNESSQEICQRIANKIVARGARGIGGMSRSFRIMDKDRNGQLDYNEVKRAMYDYHIASSDREIQAIFEICDTNRNQKLDFHEFIRAVVGEMNPQRQAIVKMAFDKLDQQLDGTIDLSDIKRIYNAKKHPDVVSGMRSEDDVLCEFLDTFEAHYAERFGLKDKDRRINLQEWTEYYNHVSANIDDDQHFIELVKRPYGL